MSDSNELIKALLLQQWLANRDKKPRRYEDDYKQELREAYNSSLTKESFQVGQLVKWKKHLRNRRLPEEHQPAIVIRMLDTPVISNEKDTGSPYFQEELDVVIGVFDDEGDFLTFHYDSRRFEVIE